MRACSFLFSGALALAPVALAIGDDQPAALGVAELHVAEMIEAEFAASGDARLERLAASIRNGDVTAEEASAVIAVWRHLAAGSSSRPSRVAADSAAPVAATTTTRAPTSVVAEPAPAPDLDPEDAARAEAALAELADLSVAEPVAPAPQRAPAATTTTAPVVPAAAAASQAETAVAGPQASVAAVRYHNDLQLVMLDVGADNGIGVQQRYQVQRDGQVVARILVTKTEASFAMAMVIPGSGPNGGDPALVVGDLVPLAVDAE